MSKASIQPTTSPETTLYQRIGQSNLELIVSNFVDEMQECGKLVQFYESVSMGTLKTHLVNIFQKLLGRKECIPALDELLDRMLIAHTRLFRDLGVNEKHFDMLTQSLVTGMQCIVDDESLIDEVVAIISPLRIVFVYGSRVAVATQMQTVASSKKGCSKLTILSGKLMLDWAEQSASDSILDNQDKFVNVILPIRTKKMTVSESKWLADILFNTKLVEEKATRVGGKQLQSGKGIVRAWTACLADLYIADELVSNHLMEIESYQAQYEYLVEFLMLAFSDHMPMHTKKNENKVIKAVMYPYDGKDEKNGTEISQALPLNVYDKMVKLFQEVCIDIEDGQCRTIFQPPMQWKDAVQKLKSFRTKFGNASITESASVSPIGSKMTKWPQRQQPILTTSSPRRNAAAISAMARHRRRISLQTASLSFPGSTNDGTCSSDCGIKIHMDLSQSSCQNFESHGLYNVTENNDPLSITIRSYESDSTDESAIVTKCMERPTKTTKKSRLPIRVIPRFFQRKKTIDNVY